MKIASLIHIQEGYGVIDNLTFSGTNARVKAEEAFIAMVSGYLNISEEIKETMIGLNWIKIYNRDFFLTETTCIETNDYTVEKESN